MGKRPKREEAVNGRRESNRMSGVEAAYVVESYLLKNHYHRSLAEFRIEAAPDLSSLKSAPAYVRTVTNILDECIALRVEQREYVQQKASMEKLVEGMQELLASYQTGLLLPRSPSCRPPTTIACAPRQLFNNQGGSNELFSTGNATKRESGKKPQQQSAANSSHGCLPFGSKTSSSSPPGVQSVNPTMPPTVIRRTRRHSRTMALPPPQASLYSMTVDTKQQQAPHPSFPFLTPPPNPSWSTAATAVNVLLTVDAQQQQQLSLQSSQAPLQKQCPSASPSLHHSSPTESEIQGKKIHATKVVQEGNDKGPGTPPRQPLCEKNMSPDSSFLKALQENNELETELISLSSVQKPMEKVLESRSQKENCSPLKGLRNCPPRSNLSTKQNQALKKRALLSPNCTVSPKKVKALPVSAATPKEAHPCSPVPLVVASKDCPCSSLCTEDQNKDLFSAPCPTEDPGMEACSKLGSDLVSTLIASPGIQSTNSAWILPETTHRDLPSIHGSSAELDPTSCLSIRESALDKDLGVSTFDLIESGDSQGCRGNEQMSEPLISIDDILEWDGCCFSDLMSGMLSDSMQGSFSRAEDELPDPCNSSRSLTTPDRFEYNCLVDAIDYEGHLPQLSGAVDNKNTYSGITSQGIGPA